MFFFWWLICGRETRRGEGYVAYCSHKTLLSIDWSIHFGWRHKQRWFFIATWYFHTIWISKYPFCLSLICCQWKFFLFFVSSLPKICERFGMCVAFVNEFFEHECCEILFCLYKSIIQPQKHIRSERPNKILRTWMIKQQIININMNTKHNDNNQEESGPRSSDKRSGKGALNGTPEFVEIFEKTQEKQNNNQWNGQETKQGSRFVCLAFFSAFCCGCW